MSRDIETADYSNNNEKKDEEIKEHIYDRCHRFKIGRWKFFRLDFNPVVTFFSAAIIWGLVVWCMVEPEKVGKKDNFILCSTIIPLCSVSISKLVFAVNKCDICCYAIKYILLLLSKNFSFTKSLKYAIPYPFFDGFHFVFLNIFHG